MYSIVFKTVDSQETYQCHCVIQDGTEIWDHPTLESAVESLISAAKFMNGTTISASDIKFYNLGLLKAPPSTENSSPAKPAKPCQPATRMIDFDVDNW